MFNKRSFEKSIGEISGEDLGWLGEVRKGNVDKKNGRGSPKSVMGMVASSKWVKAWNLVEK